MGGGLGWGGEMASSPWIHGYIHGIYVFFFFNFFLVDERESQGESGRVSVSVKERCQKIGKRQRCYTKAADEAQSRLHMCTYATLRTVQ